MTSTVPMSKARDMLVSVADSILRTEDEHRKSESDSLTAEDIERALTLASEMVRKILGSVADETLINETRRELEARYFTTVARYFVLDDDTGHVNWLPKRKPDIDWRFWKRYSDFLQNQKYHDIRQPMKGDAKYCHVRLLDPKKPNGELADSVSSAAQARSAAAESA